MTLRLENRVAIVTGAAQGIGKATAIKLAKRGATVVGVDLSEGKLAALMKDIGGHGRCVDVTERGACETLVAEVASSFGRIDILTNVAGGLAGASKGIDDITLDEYERVLAVNIDAPFRLTKAVAPIMKSQNWGRIISVGSVAGRSYTRSRVLPYGIAKAGLHALMRDMAWELGRYGVTANTVAPGTVMNDRIAADWEKRSEADRQARLAAVPMGRLAEVEEVANVIAFLASEEASYVIGQTIMLDGGTFMF